MNIFYDFINAFWSGLQAVLSWLLDGALYVLKAALYFPFDGLLTCISSFVSALDLSGILFTSATTWGALPPQLLYVLNQIALPQCLSLMLYAYIIRLTLNLIPAALTRI